MTMNNDTPADAITALQNLSSFVGAGGLDVTDVASLDKRIRWGIDVQVSVAIQMAAQIVEDCSKVPSTKWGQVKAAILGLDTCKHPYTRTTSLAAQDGLVEALELAFDFACKVNALLTPLKSEWQDVNMWTEYDEGVFQMRPKVTLALQAALSAIKGDKS